MDIQSIADRIVEYKIDLRSNSKDMLVVFALVCVCLVMFLFVFGASSMSSYGSMRSIVGGIANQGATADSLASQYADMTEAFDKGDVSFVYHFGGLPVAVDKENHPAGEKACISYVLDLYTSCVYNVYTGGDMGRLYSVAGTGAHGTYTTLMAVLIVIILVLSWFMWEGVRMYARDMGKALVICGLLSFALMFFVSNIALGSWVNTQTDSQSYWEALPIVVSVVQGSFQTYCIIYLVIGAILFGASYYEGMGLDGVNR